jgi:hypothetical protein
VPCTLIKKLAICGHTRGILRFKTSAQTTVLRCMKPPSNGVMRKMCSRDDWSRTRNTRTSEKYGQSLSRFRLSRCASQMFYQIKMIPFLAPYRLASFKKADENMLSLICDFFKSPITFISLPYVGTRFVGVSLFADFCSPCVENVICWRGCTIYFQTPCTVIR